MNSIFPHKGCPVCGHPELDALDESGATTFEVCSSCGMESGYEYQADATAVHLANLRRIWFVDTGARWWRRPDNPPPGWDPRMQLQRAGLAIPGD